MAILDEFLEWINDEKHALLRIKITKNQHRTVKIGKNKSKGYWQTTKVVAGSQRVNWYTCE